MFKVILKRCCWVLWKPIAFIVLSICFKKEVVCLFFVLFCVKIIMIIYSFEMTFTLITVSIDNYKIFFLINLINNF